jgi:hypothetical protein
MSIQDFFNPKKGRPLLLVLSVYLIGRSIYYLVAGKPEFYGSFLNSNQFTEVVLQVSIPMSIMTIMWPVIFVILNLFHKDFRLSSVIFYTTVIIHLSSSIISAIWLGLDSDIHVIFEGRLNGRYQVYTITVITFVTSALACVAYRKNIRLFSDNA